MGGLSGSHASHEAASASSPSGFDPGRDADNLGECRGCGRYAPICSELDGDRLCYPCANDWLKGEEDAWREMQRGEDWQ